MARTSPVAGVAVLDSLAGYEMAAAVRRLNVPLRAVNGDLYETDVAGVRRFKTDFEAVIMPHMGHYPMLEQPDTFNRLLSEVISALDKR
jgi:pimeloyl-ACP methyl ester carboxylesterase